MCAELKDEKKTGKTFAQSYGKDMFQYTEDTTDSDEFVPFTVPAPKSKPPPKSKATLKQSDRSQKPSTEKIINKQTPKIEPLPQRTERLAQRNEKLSERTDALPQRTDKLPQSQALPQKDRDPVKPLMPDVKPLMPVEKKEMHEQKKLPKSFSNLYDNYDDDGSEFEEEEVPKRQTFWPSQNQSHKWNQESWGQTSQSKTGQKWNEAPSNGNKGRNLKQDNWQERDAHGGAKSRDWKHENSDGANARSRDWKQDTRQETNSSANAKSRDWKRSESTSEGSPQKSRNFKADFYKNKSDAEKDDRKSPSEKHVKFEDDPAPRPIEANFAISKSSFDESLYSNQSQRSKATRISSSDVKPKPAVPRKQDSAPSQSTKPSQSNSKPLGVNSWKHKVSNNAEVTRLETDLKVIDLNKSVTKNEALPDKHKALPVKHEVLPPPSSSPENSRSPTPTDQVSPELCPPDPPVSLKSTVLDEIKTEVKLPQDNHIYNFYLNKQLGKKTDDHLYDPPDENNSSLNQFMVNYLSSSGQTLPYTPVPSSTAPIMSSVPYQSVPSHPNSGPNYSAPSYPNSVAQNPAPAYSNIPPPGAHYPFAGHNPVRSYPNPASAYIYPGYALPHPNTYGYYQPRGPIAPLPSQVPYPTASTPVPPSPPATWSNEPPIWGNTPSTSTPAPTSWGNGLPPPINGPVSPNTWSNTALPTHRSAPSINEPANSWTAPPCDGPAPSGSWNNAPAPPSTWGSLPPPVPWPEDPASEGSQVSTCKFICVINTIQITVFSLIDRMK